MPAGTVNIWNPADNGQPLRFWRWAEADSAFGVSGQINNPNQALSNCGAPWQTTCTVAGNNAGNNDEIFAFHPGGANALFGDGSVKFMKSTTNVVDPSEHRHSQRRRSYLGRPVLIHQPSH